jgi:ABC-2 type transport system ATP-binding protein
LIEAQKINKYYGPFHALKDVTFQVKKGEIVGFLGPNGAGKTTTMRILTGFMPASSGAVRIAGYEVQSQSLQVRKKIGYLPESVPLYKDMTVRSFLRFYGTIRGMSGRAREKRIEEVIDICRLKDYARSHISKLSKGYRQLVGVAQAILHEPEVIILDEPTIGIDPRQVVFIRNIIKELGQDHTVILSSHILPEVSMICQRVMIMNKGRIIAVDRPKNLSARLEGGQRYDIEISGPYKAVISRLKKIKGVQDVTATGSGESRIYQVFLESGSDRRDEISSAIIESGFRLLGLQIHEMSLEDIFLRLTTKEEASNS